MSRILIVEDEVDIAAVLADDLQLEGHQVEIAADGNIALRRAREEAWDLILLDLMLPRKDGLDVCRELRAARILTPIIILTANTHEAEKSSWPGTRRRRLRDEAVQSARASRAHQSGAATVS